MHLQIHANANGDQTLFHGSNPFKSFGQLAHFELGGKTIGLIGGSGTIGLKTGKLARAFGMNVLVWSRSAKDCGDGKYKAASDLKELLNNSDFVSIHCPLNAATAGLLNKQTLGWMKPTAFLINTARGAVIDEDDLIAVLKSKTIAGAAMDVQHPEPPTVSSPLFELNNVIVTPHIGWKRVETRQRLVNAVAENVRAFLAGAPVNVVNS
jgi:glycerate dehydrogenase|tara:strand:- start:698 stop:1324 length:627 start_codon:yes stop_codon:yes gene_type:complete